MTDLPTLAYTRPRTLPQALTALRRRGACIYAGGTDLLVALQRRDAAVEWVREVVDIKDLRIATGITLHKGELRIGALVTAQELLASAVVRRQAPALYEAARATSAPLLRARGTVGGNIMTHHPSGDLLTALLALRARVAVSGSRGGQRRMSLQRFVARTAPKTRGVLIIAVFVPLKARSAYEKLAHRHAFARALASTAVAVHHAGVSIAIGGVGARPTVVACRRAQLNAPADDQTVLRAAGVPASLDATTQRLVAALVRRAWARVA